MIFGALCGLAISGAGAQQTSDLWGNSGERWSPASRLPDFSYAGYHSGEKAIPTVAVKANVKDFGAKGDGIADDTKAFNDAIASVSEGAVFVPAGRYKITDFIYIRKSGVVLRGAGPESATLWFPKPLNEVHPLGSRTSTGDSTTAYSFDYAFLTLQGSFGSNPLASITAEAKRGDTVISVASTAGLKVGQRIQIQAREDMAQSLKTYLYAGDPGPIDNGKKLDARMVSSIVGIDGDKVRLNRPLRFETRAAWTPQILAFEPTVTESGFEDIRLDFPDVPYPGHFKEQGYNAFELSEVSDCWVRNVLIQNADMGILFVNYACFNTSRETVNSAYAGRGSLGAHHGFQIKISQDNLITAFDMRLRCVHDLSVENASGNVIGNGKGIDLAFDHHCDTPFANLYVDIDAGMGTRVFESGGGAGIGKHAAAWSTFWNIRAAKDFNPPPTSWGPPLINFVAIRTAAASAKDVSGKWLETVPPAQIQPQDIHAAQLSRRLALTSQAIRPPKVKSRHRNAAAWRLERFLILFDQVGHAPGLVGGIPASANLQGRRIP
jgi:hypothetical protein